MALVTVEGTYHDGKVELAEKPDGVEGARVIVTFLTSNGAGVAMDQPGTGVEITQVSDEERKQALQRVLARMEKGIDLGGPPYPTREEIYAERLERFDR